jgi:hypothetical protein
MITSAACGDKSGFWILGFVEADIFSLPIKIYFSLGFQFNNSFNRFPTPHFSPFKQITLVSLPISFDSTIIKPALSANWVISSGLMILFCFGGTPYFLK